jgi:excisionase family DNA binding protein
MADRHHDRDAAPPPRVPALPEQSPQAPPKVTKRLYSIREAAEYLSLSTWTVRELIWKGTLPHVRLGRRILVDLQDLDALIRCNKIRES